MSSKMSEISVGGVTLGMQTTNNKEQKEIKKEQKQNDLVRQFIQEQYHRFMDKVQQTTHN
jgi:hypothetical protein